MGRSAERPDGTGMEWFQPPPHVPHAIPRGTAPAPGQLEIRVNGQPVALTWRTPGADDNLALGFLYCEGVLRSLDDISGINPCWHPCKESSGDVLDVQSAPGVHVDIQHALDSRRFTILSAVCGRNPPGAPAASSCALPLGPRLSPRAVAACARGFEVLSPPVLRKSGFHAAAAFSAEGDLLAAHEDVSSQNAADKVVGDLLRHRRLGAGIRLASDAERPTVLVVTGASSFEIVQKAAAAGIPVIVSTTVGRGLTMDLAVALGVTLTTMGRGELLNVYSCPERLGLAPSTETILRAPGLRDAHP
ncbi:formate dehydrogenase accessory sulfurtransferase FdhD [Chondromyces apiculatus]|nr:formate dehydrogenase accessory sulfurtransferase FdhD [Chondromyces apiculatus]